MEILSHLISNSMTVHRGQSTIRKSFLRCGPGICGHNKKVEEETNKSIYFARHKQINWITFIHCSSWVEQAIENLYCRKYTFYPTVLSGRHGEAARRNIKGWSNADRDCIFQPNITQNCENNIELNRNS